MNATNKHESKIIPLSLRAMQTCNDLLVARGQNGLEKQAVEKRSSRTVLLASCVTTILLVTIAMIRKLDSRNIIKMI